MEKSRMLMIPLLVLLAAPGIPAEEHGQRSTASLQKVLGSPAWTRFNVNYISTSFRVTGESDVNRANPYGAPGLFFPKGSGRGLVFSAGLIWGARAGIGGDIRIGGTHWYGYLTPGRILDGMNLDSSDLAKNRIYRVRPDIPPGNRTADVSSEVNDGEGDAASIYEQYHKDWNEWPWQNGAPFDDRNKNGSFDPATDVPGVPGADQTIWGAARDLPNTQHFNTLPLGIEMQTTVWGYRGEGALGHMLFRRYLLINRNTMTFDSMYVALWADPDDGNPGDDLAGCDTTRSLGFVYNAKEADTRYSPLPPPAVGYDFFQGPIVPADPGDSAIFKGKRVYGKRNLPMTAFFANTGGLQGTVLADPLDYMDNPLYAPKMYWNLQGLLAESGQPYVDPGTGAPTRFPFAGDPEKKTGWLDGTHGLSYGDRRIGISSGPFTMMPGDTQEVVIAEICAGAFAGCDRLSAIGLLKFYDDQAQAAYNNLFAVPREPAQPKVSVSALDKEIILDWGLDTAAVAATEKPSPLGYAFEGYNVYQLPSASAPISDGKKLATFDMINGVGKIIDNEFDATQGTVLPKVKQFGTDSGVQRWFRITTDRFNSDRPLINGMPYYVAVTAYNYNPTPGVIPATLETPPVIYTVLPHAPDPGTRFAAHYGDTIAPVIQTTLPGLAPSDGAVIPCVVNPALVTGHQYSVSFNNVQGNTSWKLTDVTTGQVRLANQINQSGNNLYEAVDGLKVIVVGPSPGMKGYEIPSGSRRWSSVGATAYADHMEGFSGAMGWAANVWGGNVGPSELRNVLLKLAPVTADGLFDPNHENVSYAYRFMRGAQNSPAKPEFEQFIKNKENYGLQDYEKSCPFSAWNIETTPPTRLGIMILENNVAAGLVDGKYWPGLTDVDNCATSGPREWFFILNEAYSTSPNPVYKNLNTGSDDMPLMWMSVANRRGATAWADGDQFLILANHVNWPGNTFSFTAPKNTTGNQALAREDVGRINVFPNPYYGVNPQELNKYQRFVTFNHLPKKAIIRIFNLAGVMVRLINREGDSQFERWDLTNDSGLPVGSGLYIAHIDMPDLGATKILKIAIVQEQQILDRY